MSSRFRFENWKKNYPTNIFEYLLTPCTNQLRLVNFLFQKVFGVNRKVKFMVHYTSSVSWDVEIGKNVAISLAVSGNLYIQGISGVKIGDNTLIAPGVKIISANHDFENKLDYVRKLPVVIGKNCWIGANAVILPGVELGDNVIVGAGSVVTKSFGNNLIIAGNPAVVIRENSK